MGSDVEILKKVKDDGVNFVNLEFTDVTGRVKNVTISVKYLKNSIEKGTWFDGSSIEGFTRIFESDMFLRPDVSTYAVIPWLESPDGNTARIICDVCKADGTPFEGDPRYVLKKVLAEATEMGYDFKTGPEMEFFLFRENDCVEPLLHDSAGYFDLNMDKAFEIRRDMTVALQKMGIDVEMCHHEVAPGSHEIDFHYDDALVSADRVVTLKYVLKAIAQRHELIATFMPKPVTGENGSGMHVHQSLFDVKTKKNVFFDANEEYNLSKLAINYIAGQMAHARGMSAILSPLVNSYKRLVPGYEAATYICWAHHNRSALIRIPRFTKGNENAARVELRCPDPTTNPYLAFAVMLKAGLEGIKKGMEPPEPIEEDVFHFSFEQLDEKGIATLPGSLYEAIEEMKRDPLIRETLGQHVYERYVRVKEAEWDDFRTYVTDWEIKRYLRLI